MSEEVVSVKNLKRGTALGTLILKKRSTVLTDMLYAYVYPLTRRWVIKYLVGHMKVPGQRYHSGR